MRRYDVVAHETESTVHAESHEDAAAIACGWDSHAQLIAAPGLYWGPSMRQSGTGRRYVMVITICEGEDDWTQHLVEVR